MHRDIECSFNAAKTDLVALRGIVANSRVFVVVFLKNRNAHKSPREVSELDLLSEVELCFEETDSLIPQLGTPCLLSASQEILSTHVSKYNDWMTPLYGFECGSEFCLRH